MVSVIVNPNAVLLGLHNFLTMKVEVAIIETIIKLLFEKNNSLITYEA